MTNPRPEDIEAIRALCKTGKTKAYEQLDGLSRESIVNDYERGRQTGRCQAFSELLDSAALDQVRQQLAEMTAEKEKWHQAWLDETKDGDALIARVEAAEAKLAEAEAEMTRLKVDVQNWQVRAEASEARVAANDRGHELLEENARLLIEQRRGYENAVNLARIAVAEEQQKRAQQHDALRTALAALVEKWRTTARTLDSNYDAIGRAECADDLADLLASGAEQP